MVSIIQTVFVKKSDCFYFVHFVLNWVFINVLVKYNLRYIIGRNEIHDVTQCGIKHFNILRTFQGKVQKNTSNLSYNIAYILYKFIDIVSTQNYLFLPYIYQQLQIYFPFQSFMFQFFKFKVLLIIPQMIQIGSRFTKNVLLCG